MFKLSLKDWIEIAQKTEVKARSLGRGRDDGVFEEQQFVKDTVQETSGLLDCKEGWRPLTGASGELWGTFSISSRSVDSGFIFLTSWPLCPPPAPLCP